MKVYSKVDFSKKIRTWDGFGVNYVETAQTPDYDKDAQDYGGFSILDEDKKQEILNLIFGKDGLKPSLIKMFLDPFHQKLEDINQAGVGNIEQKNYDHETFTKNMRHFVKEGIRLSETDNRKIDVITTLYGPPAFMTKQKFVRGRDLDEGFKEELAKYLMAWAKYLIENENISLKYISLHNEGEDYLRWPDDANSPNWEEGHDYNMYWTPALVAEMITLTKKVLEANGLEDVGVTPGETSNWVRFNDWGYADAICDDEQALKALGLITSHGFYGGMYSRFFGDHRSVGVDKLREKKPELHSWVTSASWSNMDSKFIYEIYSNIYTAKNNAIIPWACIQRPTKWVGGDPNPGNAITVNEDGTFTVQKGYFYFKQVCSVGQAGMAICQSTSTDSEVAIISFGSNGTPNNDAFVVINTSGDDKEFHISVLGCDAREFSSFITSDHDDCKVLADISCVQNQIIYISPANSVTTFVSKN